MSERVLIIDNGSHSIKAGFDDDESPHIFPSVVGHPHSLGKSSVSYICNDAQIRRELLNLRYPIDRGIVTNWEDMEKIWHHVYQEMKADPKQHGVLISEAPFNPKANREKMAQVMFESFEVPAMHVELEGILGLYSKGYIIGTVVTVGHGFSHVMSFEDWSGFTKSVKRLDLAGKDVTQQLVTLLAAQGHSLPNYVVEEIKEKYAHVATNSDNNSNDPRKPTSPTDIYELPDGQKINIGKAKFECAEILFQPSLVGLQNEGIHKLVYNSIMGAPVDYRRTCLQNIYVIGGSSMLEGFIARLTKELGILIPKYLRVATDSYRHYSVFYGATTFASSSRFSEYCVTKEEYEEYGPFIINYNKI